MLIYLPNLNRLDVCLCLSPSYASCESTYLWALPCLKDIIKYAVAVHSLIFQLVGGVEYTLAGLFIHAPSYSSSSCNRPLLCIPQHFHHVLILNRLFRLSITHWNFFCQVRHIFKNIYISLNSLAWVTVVCTSLSCYLHVTNPSDTVCRLFT